MPIASWILFPAPGAWDAMLADVALLDGCELHTDPQARIAILVTDTPDPSADQALHDRLQDLPSIAQASLAFAHAEEKP